MRKAVIVFIILAFSGYGIYLGAVTGRSMLEDFGWRPTIVPLLVGYFCGIVATLIVTTLFRNPR